MAKGLKGYVAIVLTDESATVLRDMAVHANVHCHHLTLAFRPSEQEWQETYAGFEGTTLELAVVGIASDDRGQAVLVDLPSGLPCKNGNPHVTISCAEGTAPKYSNDLLDAAKVAGTIEPKSLVLKGIVTFVSF